MCTVLLPPRDNPIAVNIYIVPYRIISYHNRVDQNKSNQEPEKKEKIKALKPI
jgi:hypothetical protein